MPVCPRRIWSIDRRLDRRLDRKGGGARPYPMPMSQGLQAAVAVGSLPMSHGLQAASGCVYIRCRWPKDYRRRPVIGGSFFIHPFILFGPCFRSAPTDQPLRIGPYGSDGAYSDRPLRIGWRVFGSAPTDPDGLSDGASSAMGSRPHRARRCRDNGTAHDRSKDRQMGRAWLECNQFLLGSTRRPLAIHGIISRNFWPTSSIG